MNTLNKEIRTTEMVILDRKVEENEMKKELETTKMKLKSGLDVKDKAFSNEDKREAFVCESPLVKELMQKLKDYEYTTKIIEIDLAYKKRELQILIAYMAKEVMV